MLLKPNLPCTRSGPRAPIRSASVEPPRQSGGRTFGDPLNSLLQNSFQSVQVPFNVARIVVQMDRGSHPAFAAQDDYSGLRERCSNLRWSRMGKRGPEQPRKSSLSTSTIVRQSRDQLLAGTILRFTPSCFALNHGKMSAVSITMSAHDCVHPLQSAISLS